MYMIHPAYLMDVLERLVDGEIPNQIIVPDSVQEGSMLALNRMLSIQSEFHGKLSRFCCSIRYSNTLSCYFSFTARNEKDVTLETLRTLMHAQKYDLDWITISEI